MLAAAVVLILACGVFANEKLSLSLWMDEAWSVHVAQQPGINGTFELLEADIHPPLYFLLLKLHPMLGESLYLVRVMSLFMGLGTVALTYRFATDLYDSASVGLMAAFLVATSDLMIGTTAVIRHYSLYALLATLSSYLAHRLSRRWTAGLAVAYGMTVVALMYTLYFAAFIVMAQLLYLLWKQPHAWRRYAFLTAIMSLFYVGWLPVLYHQWQAGIEQGYLSALQFDRQGIEILTFQLFGVPEAIFMVLCGAGLLHFGRRPTLDLASVLPASVLTVALVTPALMDVLAGYRVLGHRQMLALVPPVMILVGRAVVGLGGWQSLVIIVALGINNLTTFGAGTPARGPWSELADALERLAMPTDQIVFETTDPFQFYIVEQHMDLIESRLTVSEFSDLDSQRAAIWVVEYLDDPHWGGADLASAGYRATTPPLHFGFFEVDDVYARLYQRAPTDRHVSDFGALLRLVSASHDKHDNWLDVGLTWSVLEHPERNYTVSVFLLVPGGPLVSQDDSYPLGGLNPTGTWQPGELHYDLHRLDVGALEPGDYQLAVQVYGLWDLANLLSDPCQVEGCRYIIVDTITLGT